MPRLGGRPASTGNANDVTDKSRVCDLLFNSHLLFNIPLIFSAREPGLSDILIHFSSWGSIEWRRGFFITVLHIRKFYKLYQSFFDSGSFVE